MPVAATRSITASFTHGGVVPRGRAAVVLFRKGKAMTTPLNSPAVDGHGLGGLRLSVLRPGGRPADAVATLSGRFDELTLVGLVVHTNRWNYELRPLPQSSRTSAPREQAPAVWLVTDRHSRGDRFILPAGEDGLADLLRHYATSGNYVTSGDSPFAELLSFCGAVRVHDHRPTG
jgi:hypothetical protein